MPCNSCLQELFQNLGYSLWVPQTYGIDAIVISPGNSLLYQSTENGNDTIPGQPGSDWTITTVAVLIAVGSGSTFTYPTWTSGGGAGLDGTYNFGQAVVYDGGNYISLINGNGDTPGLTDNWQSFAMNDTP